MRLIFMGPQGSGKGTQAKIISEIINVPHISTGDLLRNIKGELKEKVDAIINKGNLIPDDLMLEILKQRVSEKDCKKGFILDGFPRNLKQAGDLERAVEIDRYFEISIPDEESVRRLSGRRTCKNCGMIYNLNTAPRPRQADKCDKCRGELFQRADDNPEAIKKRLEIYHKDTGLIIEKHDAIRINGKQSIEKVTHDILEKLG